MRLEYVGAQSVLVGVVKVRLMYNGSMAFVQCRCVW